MKNLLQKVSVAGLVLFYPAISLAQVSATAAKAGACADREDVMFIICKIQEILNAIIPLLIGLGVVYFAWVIVQYVIGDGEEAKTQGKDRAIYGIIGLVVILSLWGLVRIVTNTFELDGENSNAPTKVEIDRLLPGKK